MIEIAPAQRCTCRRALRSGTYYFCREKCRGCGRFVVLSRTERRQLMQQELEEERCAEAPWLRRGAA